MKVKFELERLETRAYMGILPVPIDAPDHESDPGIFHSN